MKREFFVAASEAAGRLDRFLALHLPELSRTRIQELISADLVEVDGRSARGSQKLRPGQRVQIDPQPRPAPRAEPESIPLEILYEDDDLLVVNKPAGMTVHAGAGQSSGTLVNALLGRGQSLSRGGHALRPGIVHRIDKETSGALVVAKNDFIHARLAGAFQRREVTKIYLALVEGKFSSPRGRIDLAIGRDPRRRTRMTARNSAAGRARDARTDWRLLASLGDLALLAVRLHTGRTHQIRVHFSALKHPVVGDTLYGARRLEQSGGKPLPALGHNFLPAARLAFLPPRSGAPVDVRAPLPPELRDYLTQLATATGQDPGRIDALLQSSL